MHERMKKMKKITIVLLAVMLMMTFVACKKKTPSGGEVTPTANPTIDATEAPTNEPTSEPSTEPSTEPSQEPQDPTEPSEEPKSELMIQLEQILSGTEGLEIMLAPTMAVELTNTDSLSYFTGLSDATGIKEAVYAEPMMSSIAFSAVLIELEDGTDAEAVKKNIVDNINQSKWICVSAEKIIANNSGNIVMFVMTSSDLADAVMASFNTVYEGGEMGTPVERVAAQ